MFELLVHGFVALLVFVDLYQHWTHHKRNKAKRAGEVKYTLAEAKQILFNEAVLTDPAGLANRKRTIV
jgi:hypothetical protein